MSYSPVIIIKGKILLTCLSFPFLRGLKLFQIASRRVPGILFKGVTEAVPVVEAAFLRKPMHVQRADIRSEHKIDAIPYSQLIDIIVEAMACHAVKKGRQLVDRDIQASG